MQIQTVTGGPMDVNTYIVSFDTHCMVIDPGAEYARIAERIQQPVSAILLTHGHVDHMLALPDFRQPDLPVVLHELDAPYLTDPELNVSWMIGMDFRIEPADCRLVKEGAFVLAGVDIQVLHTPGHTPGSVCYRIGDVLFSGDTLFHLSYGRTDLPGGNAQDMLQSLMRLRKMEKHLAVYPGHGPATTLGQEQWMAG